VTHRGLSTSFTVVTGHEDPWAATETDWDAVARVGGTIVVLMGAATRADIAERLMAAGRPGDTPVVAVRWGTRPNQTTVRTTLAGLGAASVESPSTIVIGAVAALDLAWFDQRPLFGRRIVVTRAREQASELRRRLELLGAEVVEIPTITIEPIASTGLADRVAAGVDWVVCTSPNAVRALTAELHDARDLGRAKVGVIGPGTAAALEAFGIRPDLLPERNVAEGLVEVFPPGPGRVLVPQAADARPALADGLRAKGWDVDVVVAYDTRPAVIGEDERTLARRADVITFTSASTVTNFVAGAGLDALPAVVAAIGPVTADAAADAGVAVDVVADPHTIDGLVDALVAWFSTPPGTGAGGATVQPA
jgi:uroporphyrinogen III methyltransferase/synthase